MRAGTAVYGREVERGLGGGSELLYATQRCERDRTALRVTEDGGLVVAVERKLLRLREIEKGKESVNAGAAVNLMVEIEGRMLRRRAEAAIVRKDAESTCSCHDRLYGGVLGRYEHEADMGSMVDEHHFLDLLEERIDDERGSCHWLVVLGECLILYACCLVERRDNRFGLRVLADELRI